MPFDFQQYQIKTEAPLGTFQAIASFESTFHQPWSEPVRQKINPVLAVALITSGLIAPVLNPNTQITQNYESRWHQGWSEPVRIKPALRTGLHPFTNFVNVISIPDVRLVKFQWLAEPVRQKRGLLPWLQQTITTPPRLLPPANVTMTMAATETNTDTALFDFWVYTAPSPALDLTDVEVSITEIPAADNASASIKEIES